MKCQICDREFRNKSGLLAHHKSCEKIYDNKKDIKKLYLEGYSITKLANKYHISKDTLSYVLGDQGIKRSYSDAAKLVHKLYPDSFKHTEESKQKMRDKRLEFMKNNPEQTAWRLSNLSYPEKLFRDGLKERDLDKIYLIKREMPIHPYFIDFAFINKKVAVEVDGSQHELEDRKENDRLKEQLLISNNWKVVRFTENEIKTNLSGCLDLVEDICEKRETYEAITRVGIFNNNEKNYCKCGKEITRKSKFCNKCANKLRSLTQRKVERPSYKQLLKEIKELGYSGVGRKYGVSDNSVRKWEKFYEKSKNNL